MFNANFQANTNCEYGFIYSQYVMKKMRMWYMQVQTIFFDKRKFTLKSSEDWLKKYNQ